MFRTLGERTSIRVAERDRRRREYRSVAENLSIPLHGADLRASTRVKPAVKKRAFQFKVDILLLLATISLIIFGLLMVYSASYDYSFLFYGDSTTMFTRQLIFLGIGLVGMVCLIFIDYHLWQRLAVPIMGVTILLLVCVFIVNEVLNGASRTLYQGSIQPSELAKLVTVIYLSVWLFARREQLRDVNFGLIPMAAILGLVGGLIFSQPDLSAMVMIFCLGGVLFFLAGGELRQIGLMLLVALVVGWLVVQIHPTGRERIADYLAGLKDPTKGSYHVLWSFEAFVKGGWLGVGIGRAETKLIGLPVPPTDSIFAVVGEETGVFGAVCLLGLYAMLFWRGLTIARRAPDELGALLAAGLSLWVALEAFINMSVMVNLLPFAGNALPFISSGGSSLVVSLAAVGIMLNISRLSVNKKEESGRLYNAIVDLRRWDRRRRVSRSSRTTSVARG